MRNINTLPKRWIWWGSTSRISVPLSIMYIFWKITANWTSGLMIKKMHWGIVGRHRKTFSTSGITFLTVRRLVKGTGQSREVSIKEVCLSKRGVSDTTDSFIVTSMASVDALLDTEADDATGRILFYLMYLTCNKFHSSGLFL